MLRGILRELQAPAFPPGDDRDPHHTQGAATGRRNRKQPIGQREIELSFVGAGWRVTDDSSEHLTVGNCGKLSILAYGSCMGTGDAAFELLERRHVLTYWVRTIPTPRQAAVLLEEHGGRPEEERGNPHKQ
ncbi:MAG: hypothetical protein M3441_25615 [Chloroflexota bacterium]|nr:hypothetical protein [Chloroflexota bacterium]